MRVVSGLAVLVFLGIFVLSAHFARKGELWAFILGGAVYLFDTVLLLLRGDWFAAAVHGFFLYYIIRGLLSLTDSIVSETSFGAFTTKPLLLYFSLLPA